MFKILTIEKSYGYYNLKFCGFPLYEYQYSQDGLSRVQSILNGLIKTSKKIKCPIDFCASQSVAVKTFKIAGVQFLRREEDEFGQKFFIGKKLVRTLNYENDFNKLYSKYVDSEHDDYYVINSNLGEAYVTLTYLIKTVINKNGSKSPMLLLTKPYHADLVKLLVPEYPYKILPHFTNHCSLKEFGLCGHRCFMLYPFEYFAQVEKKIKEVPGCHYFPEMLKYLSVEWNGEFNKIKLSEDVEKRMMSKIRKTALNLDNFVFIAPDAVSCNGNFASDFWQHLLSKLQQQGIWVFLNSKPEKLDCSLFKNIVCTNLPVSEAYALASKAKFIISLRSGFSELLTQLPISHYIVYTNFRRSTLNNIKAEKVLSGFTVKELPSVKKEMIKEICFDNNIEELVDDVLNEFMGCPDVL